jgi:hypothetical protein
MGTIIEDAMVLGILTIPSSPDCDIDMTIFILPSTVIEFIDLTRPFLPIIIFEVNQV